MCIVFLLDQLLKNIIVIKNLYAFSNYCPLWLSDDYSDLDTSELPLFYSTIDPITSLTLNNEHLLDDKRDDGDFANDKSHYYDNSPTFFANCFVTLRVATKFVIQFAMDVNLDKIHTLQLLELIWLLLPRPNILPTANKSR